ncbi:hypothetical protein [Alishewanella jeotgali]|uniref:Uncharacterized protein n=1 Tax=Alishewanella jeotgali KCTC 22429 TaxID=1129374 RepID=H3ZH88_9ALTE|nr:hypothetical protein [Alishewanella jeotgali]EHR40044.1 hypothetical protein AJE_13794 [Alishewanella jeotgali KCTC 22429]
MEIVLFFILDVVVSGFFLWIAGKVTTVQIGFKEGLICIGASSILALIPGVGWILSIIAFFYLLKDFTGANVWPDLILLVLVTKLFSFIAFVALGVM